MKNILIIFLKELKDVLRDRRSVMTMIIMPVLIYPILMFVVNNVMKSRQEKSGETTLNGVYIHQGDDGAELTLQLNQAPKLTVNEQKSYTYWQTDFQKNGANTSLIDSIKNSIRNDELDFAIILEPDFDANIDSLKSSKLWFLNSSTSVNVMAVNGRLKQIVEGFKRQKQMERFTNLNYDLEIIDPVNIAFEDAASNQEQIGNLAGGFLSYLFIMFCFMGSMYPAIDLAAGEKERGTIETILTSPASKLEILLGKLGVITLSGLTSGLLSLLGIFAGVKLFLGGENVFIPDGVIDMIVSLLAPESILCIVGMIIPMAIFFGGVLISMSIYAKSFKEAQSMISPMMMVMIMPLIIGMMPGMELDSTTALIPLINVSMATKEIFSGTLDYGLYFQTIASLLVLAGLSIAFSVYWFKKESTVLR